MNRYTSKLTSKPSDFIYTPKISNDLSIGDTLEDYPPCVSNIFCVVGDSWNRIRPIGRAQSSFDYHNWSSTYTWLITSVLLLLLRMPRKIALGVMEVAPRVQKE